MTQDIATNLSNGFLPVLINADGTEVQMHLPGHAGYDALIDEIRLIEQKLNVEFHEAAARMGFEIGSFLPE